MSNFFLIFAGGGLGAVARYGVYSWMQNRFPHFFPLGTLVINVSGSFLIGLALSTIVRHQANDSWRLFIAVGILGGYTTFSTFSWEVWELLSAGRIAPALAYVATSLAAAVAATGVGLWLGKTV